LVIIFLAPFERGYLKSLVGIDLQFAACWFAKRLGEAIISFF
jgi:hypothetical protein